MRRRRQVREGVLTRLESFRHPGDHKISSDFGLGAVPGCYRVYLDEDEEPAGWVAWTQVVNRVEEGERVRITTVPGDDRIRKLRPADRRLKWYQF